MNPFIQKKLTGGNKMTREEQYHALIEVVAHARLLSALSDSEEVVLNMQKVKSYGIGVAEPLGYSEVILNSDSIKRYNQLLEEYK